MTDFCASCVAASNTVAVHEVIAVSARLKYTHQRRVSGRVPGPQHQPVGTACRRGTVTAREAAARLRHRAAQLAELGTSHRLVQLGPLLRRQLHGAPAAFVAGGSTGGRCPAGNPLFGSADTGNGVFGVPGPCTAAAVFGLNVAGGAACAEPGTPVTATTVDSATASPIRILGRVNP